MALRRVLLGAAFHVQRRFSTKTYGSEGRGLSGYLLFLPAAFAGGLGIWQIQRRAWKEEMLKLRESKVFSKPFSLFDHFSDITSYDRTRARGIFLQDKSVFIGPRVRTINGMPQKGYTLITPLLDPQSHHVVLVNRGWVPESWKMDFKQARGTGDGMRSVTQVDGLVVESENPSVFVPKNDPSHGDWFWIDAKEIATHCGLPAETPLIQAIVQSADHKPPPAIHGGRGRTIEFNANERYPVAKDLSDFVTFSVMPIDHRNYSWIWFSLSIVTAGMAYRVTRKRR